MESKRLTVGDKIKFTIKKREFKKGKSLEIFDKEFSNLDDKSITYNEDVNKLINKYLQKPKTKSGISKITEIDTYYHSKDKELPIYYRLANGEIVDETKIERIPIHKK
jgi:hypothetical protein